MASNDAKRIKKGWNIGSKEGEKITFIPMFEVVEKPDDTSQVAGDVECTYVQVIKEGKNGKETMTFNYLDIYMFMYFTASEELRQNLAQRYERNVSMIPYEVEFTLDPKEKETGKAKRRIELPVDEITMAVARNEAYKMTSSKLGKGGSLNPKDYVYKRKK